jgi:drug/metabolite transporter (DMT)-like permease
LGGRAFGFLALMVLIGSSTAPAAKIAVKGVPVGLIPLVRFGLAGLCLWPIVAPGARLRQMIRQDGWRLLAGAKLAPASHIGLIYAACPLVVLAFAAFLGQERLAPERIMGVALSVLGVALIAFENVMRADTDGLGVFQGDLLEVGAVLAWGAYLTVNKPLIDRHGALPTLAATFLVGSLLDVPVALFTMPGWPPLSSVSTAAWLGLAYLAVVVSIGGLAFQNLAMRSLDASQVATFGNVAPLMTIGWGYLLFNERITPVAAIGGTLVLAGIAWSSRPSRKPVDAPRLVPEPAVSG